MNPLDLESYLDSIADKLGELGGVFLEGPNIDIDFHEVIGILQTQIGFPTGHRLDVDLTSAGPQYFSDWLDYRFHFMDGEDRCVFRYDNRPHHLGTEHFPNHKHTGPNETVSDQAEPSLAHIIEEVRSHVYP